MATTPSAVSSGNGPLRPESIPYVVLRHNRAGQRNWLKPYHIEPLSRYCARPPRNPEFKLLGIYPSERDALAAIVEDWKYVISSLQRLEDEIRKAREQIPPSPPLTPEERAQLRALGTPGKETRP